MAILTDQQREVMLRLGSSSSHEIIDADVFKQLQRLGLIAQKPDGSIDFTVSGSAVYRNLRRRIPLGQNGLSPSQYA